MAAGDIAALITSRNDVAGNPIRDFYACNPPSYVIYRTDARVMIEFADADAEERSQRTTLAPLGPIRSEINALIDGWRSSSNPRKLAKARGYDRRTADALVMALEADVASATLELNAVRNAIIDGRKSSARFMYLITAFVVALIVGLLVDVLSLPQVGLCTAWDRADDVANAVVGGVGGAFFSIATGLSRRTILTDLQQRDNALDAILRMVIGVISAAIIVCILRSGLGVTLNFVAQPGAPVPLTAPIPWMQFVTIGFLAGFSERLVPDLLAKAGAAVEATPLPAREPLKTPPPAPTTPSGGAKTDTMSPTDTTGDCCSDTRLTDAEATPDAALPAATGGTQ